MLTKCVGNPARADKSAPTASPRRGRFIVPIADLSASGAALFCQISQMRREKEKITYGTA
ncbi:MAG TPA: hypothetical protein VJ761_25970 [Ktedonobacteraceae bacterium]|nr:hypothetical protein [Ktedonobacteraceae bacterium]